MENKFAQRLLELRQDKNLTQTALAKAIGVSQKSIDFWEKGVNEPKLTYLIRLANYFSVSIDFLVGRTDY